MYAVNGEAIEQLKLAPVLDLSEAKDIAAYIRFAFEGGKIMRIDASGVEVMSTPCVQVILAALKSEGKMVIERPSRAFVDAFRDLGLDWDAQWEDAAALPADSASSGDAMDAPKRIMTIDDSKTMRDMLLVTLCDAGFEVLQAVDGQDGVEKLSEKTVDVVITDINMPRMDGYEVIRQLRSNPYHKNTPILVLTTEGDTEKRHVAREAGATGWMVKPFDPERLISTVKKVLS